MKPITLARRGLNKQVIGWLFVLPMLLFFITFVLYPIFYAIKSSLYRFDYTRYYWVGFGNYAALLKNELFRMSIKNTLIFVVFMVPSVTFISLLLASLICSHGKKLQSFFKATFYIPTVSSLVSIVIIWEYIYNFQFGMGNYVLKSIGFEPINFLGVNYVYFSLMLVLLTMSLGAPIVVFTAALNGIPKDLYEASAIDGAKAVRKFFNITFPMLKPTLLYVVVTSTIGSFQIFAIILIMTGGGPAYKTTTIMMLIYREAFINMNFGIANAMGIVLCILICFIAFIQFKLLKSDVEY